MNLLPDQTLILFLPYNLPTYRRPIPYTTYLLNEALQKSRYKPSYQVRTGTNVTHSYLYLTSFLLMCLLTT